MTQVTKTTAFIAVNWHSECSCPVLEKTVAESAYIYIYIYIYMAAVSFLAYLWQVPIE